MTSTPGTSLDPPSGAALPAGPCGLAAALRRRGWRREHSLAGVFAVFVAFIVTLSVLCIDMLGAARAFVGGESLWSKAQKEATRHLTRYALTGDAGEWQRYQAAIRVPLADRVAREQLERARPDLASVRAGLLGGGNAEGDVPRMARLYRWGRHLEVIERAAAAWSEGDALIAELQALARAIDGERAGGGDAARLSELAERVRQLDERLTPVELRFSATLAEGARSVELAVMAVMLVVGTGLVVFGALVARTLGRRGARHESELAASEARYRHAIGGSGDGIWEWDVASDAMYMSPRLLAMLDHEPGTLAGTAKGLRDLLHPDDLPRVRAAVTAHLQRGTPYDIEIRLRQRDGSWRWLRSRARVRDGGAGARRMTGSIVDIHEHKLAQDALRESEARFRALWTTTNDSVLIIDVQGTIHYANPAVEAMLGWRAEELEGRPLSLLQPPALRAAHDAGLARYVASGRRRLDWRSTEIRALHRDGHEVAVEISFAEVDCGVEQRCFVGFLRDISERKRAEEALREANERLERRVAERTRELTEANLQLQRLDRVKSEFLATMSHELRTPLNAVLGFSALLRDGISGPVNDEQRRQLGFVHGAGKHLLALINDLLDLSRIESGRIELDDAPFELGEVLAEVARSLEPELRRKGLALHCDGAAPAMHGDRRKCFQIVLNLAGNAVKFTTAGEVRIAVDADDDQARIAISDTGIGIAPEQLPRLFEAFSQLESGPRRSHEGSGLGLYLSRRFAEAMGGRIEVASEPGRGSCFSVTLPRRLAANEAR